MKGKKWLKKAVKRHYPGLPYDIEYYDNGTERGVLEVGIYCELSGEEFYERRCKLLGEMLEASYEEMHKAIRICYAPSRNMSEPARKLTKFLCRNIAESARLATIVHPGEIKERVK